MGKQVISVIGSGGKTSWIACQAQQLREEGNRVLVATTTHMWLPEQYRETGMPSIEEAAKQLQQEGILYYGREEKGTGKMKAPEQSTFAQLQQLADVILIEADGSRGLPVKQPDLTREPVIHPETTQLVLVQGLSALGQEAAQCCHRFSGVSKTVTKEWMAEQLLASYLPWIALTHPEKGLTLVWNQADTKQRVAAGQWLQAYFSNLLREKNKWNLHLNNAILSVYGRELFTGKPSGERMEKYEY